MLLALPLNQGHEARVGGRLASANCTSRQGSHDDAIYEPDKASG